MLAICAPLSTNGFEGIVGIHSFMFDSQRTTWSSIVGQLDTAPGPAGRMFSYQVYCRNSFYVTQNENELFATGIRKFQVVEAKRSLPVGPLPLRHDCDLFWKNAQPMREMLRSKPTRRTSRSEPWGSTRRRFKRH